MNHPGAADLDPAGAAARPARPSGFRRTPGHVVSTSALGSVKGKNEGRNRTAWRGPKSSRHIPCSIPLRWPKWIPSPIMRPSIWWNMIRVARIDRIAPIGFARDDDRNRRRVGLHRPDLHRRGVRAQHQIRPDVKRIEPLARRMIRRDVQRIEVVVVRFDLVAEDDREAAPLEVAARILDRAPDRMDRAVRGRRARERYVDHVLERRFQRFGAQQRLGALELRLHRLDGIVDRLARRRPLRPRQRPDLTADRGDFTAPPEVRDPQLFEPLGVDGGSQRIVEPRGERAQLLGQFAHAVAFIATKKSVRPSSRTLSHFLKAESYSARHGGRMQLPVHEIGIDRSGALEQSPKDLGRLHRRTGPLPRFFARNAVRPERLERV